ncbi:hypothetical protein CO176_00010 [Candidatus Woesebacteria bacterium CG_4_9_14_3_um_filter_39_10]|uniref:Uncharacterized protein n=1 Tax=Candidatus Woesebacteria bacterium CG_4_9_14_3_um_filter_39_10 TaxID=1975056 RepID=A0A2M7XAI3_9BACT|nr:MAG: hypothetical protein CO176_00010 [Candidatus Woesebacteria bacterium CG_4_9_14_3_um_filter_39_10]
MAGRHRFSPGRHRNLGQPGRQIPSPGGDAGGKPARRIRPYHFAESAGIEQWPVFFQPAQTKHRRHFFKKNFS